MTEIHIIPKEEKDNRWVSSLLKDQWGSENIVMRGKIYQADKLPGFIAFLDGRRTGLITYSLENDCEIVSLNSLCEGKGIGTALIEKVKQIAKKNNCKRIWVISTNDNLKALGFYQKRGFILSAIYPNALELSRKIKPQIPKTGMNNIPLRDEIELEMSLI